MAKKINLKMIRIAILVTILIMAVVVSIIPVLLNRPRKVEQKDISPSWTPVDYAYPSYFDRNQLEDGSSWRINENAMFELSTEDGTFVVSESGEVYKVAEDGSLSLEKNTEVLDRVKAGMDEAKVQNPDAGSYLPTTEIFNDINGANKESEISDAVRNQLQATIGDKNITVDELLKTIEEYGMTPEQYLQGYNALLGRNPDTDNNLGISGENNTYANNNSSNTSKPNTSIYGAQANTNPYGNQIMPNTSPLSISLGGSSASVAEKEKQYQENIQQFGGVPNPTDLASAMKGIYSTDSDYVQQNDQSGKKSFMESFAGRSGIDYLTKNDLKPTTVISMILITGINTDLPGQIIAEVTQNVYDSLTGTILLIPKGTRVTGTYSSSVSFGQSRALIAWTQLIRPDGLMLNLPGLPGIDGQGYAGYSDKVDTHFWDLVWYSGLASMIDLGAGYLSDEAKIAGEDIFSTIADAYINTVSSAGQQLMENHINRQPTIQIRPGTPIKLFVSEKLTLPEYKL